MPFAYYQRLSPRQKRIYRASDEISRIDLPRAAEAAGVLAAVRRALEDENRRGLTAASHQLLATLNRQLEVAAVEVRVLAARPNKSWGELHGLYEPAEGGEPGRVTVWMRTAQRRQVVAFRTFVRTLLHELCHHLDYEHFGLADSFHTQGFFQRESSLFHQLTEAEQAQEA